MHTPTHIEMHSMSNVHHEKYHLKVPVWISQVQHNTHKYEILLAVLTKLKRKKWHHLFLNRNGWIINSSLAALTTDLGKTVKYCKTEVCCTFGNRENKENPTLLIYSFMLFPCLENSNTYPHFSELLDSVCCNGFAQQPYSCLPK